MSLRQSLLERTNLAMSQWVHQQRATNSAVPLAVFKAKAIRVYRDLKANMHMAPDYDAQLGVLRADRKWFTNFLERHPVRYDNVYETLITPQEVVGKQMRYVVRKADMQFIFDESGGESSDEDDAVIVLPDSPPPSSPLPQPHPPPEPPKPVEPRGGSAVRGRLSGPARFANVRVAPMATNTPIQSARASATKSAARQAERSPAPTAVTRGSTRASAPATATESPMATRKTMTPRRPTATKSVVAPKPVAKPKAKLPAAKEAALASPAGRKSPVRPKPKMVSRSVQVAMEPVCKGRVFKLDNMPIRRRVNTIQRVKTVRLWVKSNDTCLERQKLVMHYFEQILNLYNMSEDALKAFQEKEQKRLQKLAANRLQKKKEREAAKELAKRISIKRSRSPDLEGASSLVQCELNASPPRVRVKHEPPDHPPRTVRVKMEPRREEQEAQLTRQLVTRIKREPREAVKIKVERGIKRERLDISDLGLGISAVNGDVPMDMLAEELSGSVPMDMSTEEVGGGVASGTEQESMNMNGSDETTSASLSNEPPLPMVNINENVIEAGQRAGSILLYAGYMRGKNNLKFLFQKKLLPTEVVRKMWVQWMYLN